MKSALQAATLAAILSFCATSASANCICSCVNGMKYLQCGPGEVPGIVCSGFCNKPEAREDLSLIVKPKRPMSIVSVDKTLEQVR